MDISDVFASTGVLGGLLLSQVFYVAADSRRVVMLVAPVAVMGAIGISRVFPGAQADAEWIAALVALATATKLAEGRHARILGIAAGLALIPAVLASISLLEVAFSSVPKALAAVAFALVAGGAAGYALRVFNRRAVLDDLALLACLCSLALMAGPTAILGWQRASIAAEGDESSYGSPSLWVLLPLSLAFVAGFAWRAWKINRTLERKKT